MQYISPFTLLPAEIGLSLTEHGFVMAKRRLMAEFELEGTATITVRGKEMTRNDVLKLFAQIETSGSLEWHAIVASDPALRFFLERQEIPYDGEITLQPQKITPDFVAWVSPYFSASFRICIVSSFRRQYIAGFLWLAGNYKIWMTKADQNIAWEGIEAELAQLCEKLESINKAKYADDDEISIFANELLMLMLCALPGVRFQPLLSSYAAELAQYAIHEFNNNNQGLAIKIIGYALLLPMDEETRQAILQKEKEMNRLLGQKTTGSWVKTGIIAKRRKKQIVARKVIKTVLIIFMAASFLAMAYAFFFKSIPK